MSEAMVSAGVFADGVMTRRMGEHERAAWDWALFCARGHDADTALDRISAAANRADAAVDRATFRGRHAEATDWARAAEAFDQAARALLR